MIIVVKATYFKFWKDKILDLEFYIQATLSIMKVKQRHCYRVYSLLTIHYICKKEKKITQGKDYFPQKKSTHKRLGYLEDSPLGSKALMA